MLSKARKGVAWTSVCMVCIRELFSTWLLLLKGNDFSTFILVVQMRFYVEEGKDG